MCSWYALKNMQEKHDEENKKMILQKRMIPILDPWLFGFINMLISMNTRRLQWKTQLKI